MSRRKNQENIQYNYNKLKGRIVEKEFTLKEFANKIGISMSSLWEIFNNSHDFRQSQIDRGKEILDIPDEEIYLYFFNRKVQ